MVGQPPRQGVWSWNLEEDAVNNEIEQHPEVKCH